MFSAELIVSMLLILSVSWLVGFIISRFGLPLLVGQLLAGVILGPPILGWVTASPPLELMAEFGIFFVMFYVGMEMDPKDLIQHFWSSLVTALGGFILPFILGFTTTRVFGGTIFQSLFMGLCISITAVAVQAVILQSMRINRSQLGHIIIGAAIVTDAMSLISLSVLLGIAKTGEFAIGSVAWIVFKAALFFGLTIVLGEFVMPKLTRRLTDRAGSGFTFAMTVAMTMALLAELAGLHLVIGAFMGGQFVRREVMDETVYEAIADRFYGISYGFLVPIFFVSLSFHLHIDWSFHYAVFFLILVIVAFSGKILGSGLAIKLFGRSLREALVVGFGMNGRGAVELVVATIILEVSDKLLTSGVIVEPLLTGDQFSALVLLAITTAVTAPMTLKWSVLRACQPDEGAEYCYLIEEQTRE